MMVAGCVLTLAAGCRSGERAATLERGGQAYLAECAVCHGANGAGDGPLASSFATEGRTPPATLDAERLAALGREGVRKAIETGAHRHPDSAMPVWGSLLSQEVMDRIADYLVAAPRAGAAAREQVARYLAAPPGTPPAGRRVYVTYCSGCHGPQGRGDGFLDLPPASHAAARLSRERLSRMDDAALTRIISPGGAHDKELGAIPGWMFTLSPDDRGALLAYLRKLPEPAGSR